MPSARRGSVPTPTSNARTGPRSSSSSRSGLGASSPGPSRSTTRAWPSAAWPSGTRRATSRRAFAASSLSLLCSVARTPAEPAVEPTPRRRRDARTFRSVLCRGGRAAEPIVEPTREPTAEPRTPPRCRRVKQPQAQGERIVGLAGGLRQGRDREEQEEAREAEAAARGRAHAHGRGLQLLRAPREHRAFPASCWFLCLRPSGAVPSPPGVDLSI